MTGQVFKESLVKDPKKSILKMHVHFPGRFMASVLSPDMKWWCDQLSVPIAPHRQKARFTRKKAYDFKHLQFMNVIIDIEYYMFWHQAFSVVVCDPSNWS